MGHIFKLSLYIWVRFLCFPACSTGEFKNPSIPDTEQQIDQDAEENDSLLLPTFSVEMLNKCNLEFSKDRWEEYFADVNCSKTYGTAQRCFIDANIYWCLEVEKFNFTDEINDQLKVIKLLDSVVPYIKTILTADFFDSLLLKDKMKLAGLFYRLNFAIACANLKILTSNDYRLDEHLIREYVRNYQKAKNELKTKFSVDTQNIQLEFFKNLSNIYMMASNKCPHIHSVFEPSIRKKLSQPRKKPSLTMLEAKRRSRNNKYSELTKDIFTASTMDPIDIFLDEEKNFVKDLDKKIEPINWKELSNRFLRLEKLAYKMVAYKEPFRMNPGKNLAHFGIEDWANLYIGIRSCAPSTEIYGFTRTGISIYIKSNRFDIAKTRLKAIEHFYTSRLGLLSDELKKDFTIFKAMSYALLGEYDELTKLYQSLIAKKVAYKNKLCERHQAKILQLKLLQEAQLQQASCSPTSMITNSMIEKEHKSLPKRDTAIANRESSNETLYQQTLSETLRQEASSEALYQQELRQRKEEAQDRQQRHQEAVNQRKLKSKLQLKEKAHQNPKGPSTLEAQRAASELNDLNALETTSIPRFDLPAKAYHTIVKVFNGDWNIRRTDIEQLFDDLGQEINKSTKSSHHIIKIPQAITLVNYDQQIIGIITNLSAQGAGHLTLPEWGKKVPTYMRKQILHLLQLIGINQENYTKAHSQGATQVIPHPRQQDQTSSIQDMANTHPSKKSKNKQKRKKKNRNLSIS